MTYPDACPACHPGIPDAAYPLTAEPVNGGTLAAYQCGACDEMWQTWFDAHGWPVSRQVAPVSAGQARKNRAALEEALAEYRACRSAS